MARGERRQDRGDQLPTVTGEQRIAPGMSVATPGQHPWEHLAASLARFVATASGMPGGAKSVDTALDLLHALHGVQDVQSDMLNAIHEDVELLRTAPYRSGLLLTDEAARVGPADDHYEKFLDDATIQLYQAHALCSSLEEQAVVELHLGIVYLLLGRSADANHWLLESCKSGHNVIDDLAARAKDVRLVRHRSASALATLSSVVTLPVTFPITAAMLVKKHKKKANSRVASAALEEFVPFVNTAARCYNSLGMEPALPTLHVNKHRGHLSIEESEGASAD